MYINDQAVDIELMQTANALIKLHKCAVWSEPLLFVQAPKPIYI